MEAVLGSLYTLGGVHYVSLTPSIPKRLSCPPEFSIPRWLSEITYLFKIFVDVEIVWHTKSYSKTSTSLTSINTWSWTITLRYVENLAQSFWDRKPPTIILRQETPGVGQWSRDRGSRVIAWFHILRGLIKVPLLCGFGIPGHHFMTDAGRSLGLRSCHATSYDLITPLRLSIQFAFTFVSN